MYEQEICNYFENFLTNNRIETLNRVLQNRTRYITVVLEDIYQSQNASAVIRTCDCMGIQNIHIVEKINRFCINADVLRGANNWVDIEKYKQTETTIKKLKNEGYRIVATSPHGGSKTPENIDLNSGKIALFFGTELTGISDAVKSEADEFISIPMVGFTESLNISVSAAIFLYTLTTRLRQTNIDWQLSEKEFIEVKTKWLRNTIKKSELIEERYKLENNLLTY